MNKESDSGTAANKQANGGDMRHRRALSIRAELRIVSNTRKRPLISPTLTTGYEIGAGWPCTGKTSGKECVFLSLAAPEFGPRKV